MKVEYACLRYHSCVYCRSLHAFPIKSIGFVCLSCITGECIPLTKLSQWLQGLIGAVVGAPLLVVRLAQEVKTTHPVSRVHGVRCFHLFTQPGRWAVALTKQRIH